MENLNKAVIIRESDLYSSYRDNLSIISIDGELWKDIDGYKDMYLVSNYFRVKSIQRVIETNGKRKSYKKIIKEKILSQYVNSSNGYWEVRLSNNKIRQLKRVHRLYALSFIDNHQNLEFINHKNLIKTDNYPSNLEWCTKKENDHHAYINGAIPFGEKVYCSKLHSGQVLDIFSSPLSHSVLANKYNVSDRAIAKIKNKISWKNITKQLYGKLE